MLLHGHACTQLNQIQLRAYVASLRSAVTPFLAGTSSTKYSVL